MRSCEQWFKVQTKATGIVLYRGTDYNDVVGKANNAHRNGWSVEVKPDNDWTAGGRVNGRKDAEQFIGVGANPATAGATS